MQRFKPGSPFYRAMSAVVVTAMLFSVTACNKANRQTVKNASSDLGQSGVSLASGASAAIAVSGAVGSDVSLSAQGASNGVGTGNGSGSGNYPATNNAKLVGNTYVSGYPLCKNKTTIKIATVKDPAHGDFDKMRFTTEIEKKMNVDIVWQLVPEDQQTERKTLMLQSGNLPDILSLFPGIVTNTDMIQYSQNGTFLELGSQLSAWGPNIKAAMQKYRSAKAAVTAADGKIYSLPNIDEDSYLHYWNINKTWLDNLGLSVPKTTADLYNVLKAFKTEDPNGNGQADEIPFASYTWMPNMFAPWGLPQSFENNFAVDKSGKVQYAWTTDNFKEGIRFWAKCYKEGLMDKDTIDASNVYATYKQVLKTGRVGVFMWSWPYQDLGMDIMKNYVVMATPDSQYKNSLFNTPTASVKQGCSSQVEITKAAKSKLSTVLRFMDFFYTPEGYYFKTYADPGYKYYDIANGQFKMRSNAGSLNSMADAPGYVIGGLNIVPKSLEYQKKDSEMTALEKAEDTYDKTAKSIYDKQKPAVVFPNVTLNMQEYNSIKSNAYWFEGGLREALPFLTGDKNIDTQWTEYYNGIVNNLGLSAYVGAYQSAYDRAAKIINGK